MSGYKEKGEPIFADLDLMSSAQDGGHKNWKNGKVPYIIGGSALPDDKEVFKSAIKEMEKISCIRFDFYIRIFNLNENINKKFRFKKRKNQKGYLEMDRSVYSNGKPTPTCRGCDSRVIFSYVEKLDGDTNMTLRLMTGVSKLNSSRSSTLHILHELYHVMGMIHTQSRSDRYRSKIQ